MKEAELRKLATCAVCRRKLGQTGSPLFYVVRAERLILDARAIGRQAALETLVGSPAIAGAIGPDEDLAKAVDSFTVTVCQTCAVDAVLLQLAEAAADQPEPRA